MDDPTQRLTQLLTSREILTEANANRTARIFYDAAKIVHCRQKALKKQTLKMKEIAGALILAESFHSNSFRFSAVGHLAALFGRCDQAKALDYYDKYVIGQVTDAFGRSIVIDEDGMRSLYKDAATGKHIVSDENYEEVRGKRLPWIRHVLEKSTAIFQTQRNIRGIVGRVYLYTAIVSIPAGDLNPHVSYYVSVVRENDQNKQLKFVTAYSVFVCDEFLRLIAVASPYGQMKSE